nr:hypothetical protein [Tanacetum cinerariifolium]
MFKSGSYISHLDHAALYKALEASMQHENNDELHESLTTSRKRRRDDQDPPQPPPKNSNQSKKKNKPLPLGGPPGQVTIQTHYLFNKDLKYLVSCNKERRHALSISKLKTTYYLDFRLEEFVSSLWTKSKSDYGISSAYGISHWLFKHNEFYITRHSAPSDRNAVRSHMRILSIVSLMTFSRYGYTYLKEIVLRRADYKEYKISEVNFKNLHLNDFEDMYLLNL